MRGFVVSPSADTISEVILPRQNLVGFSRPNRSHVLWHRSWHMVLFRGGGGVFEGASLGSPAESVTLWSDLIGALQIP